MGRYCSSCHSSHEKPTGKRCWRTETQAEHPHDTGTADNGEVISLLRTMQQQMTGLQERMNSMEARQTEGESEQAQVNPPQTTHTIGDQQMTATPDSLRANTGAVSDVAAKLAAWGFSEEDTDASMSTAQQWRPRAKRPGKVTKGTDVIKKIIDWPHYHVRKGPNRVPPEYAQLTAEEFILGFVRMLRTPDS